MLNGALPICDWEVADAENARATDGTRNAGRLVDGAAEEITLRAELRDVESMLAAGMCGQLLSKRSSSPVWMRLFPKLSAADARTDRVDWRARAHLQQIGRAHV